MGAAGGGGGFESSDGQGSSLVRAGGGGGGRVEVGMAMNQEVRLERAVKCRIALDVENLVCLEI